MLKDNPIVLDLLDPRAHLSGRIDSTKRPFMGLMRALSPSNGVPVRYKFEAALST